MSASDHLHKDLFHGTWAGWLRKGQLIRPAYDLKRDLFGLTNYKISSPEHVYATHNPDDAQWYAEQGYKEMEKMGFELGGHRIYGVQPVVYRVEPRGIVEQDPSRDYQDRQSVRIHGPAKILERHWEAS